MTKTELKQYVDAGLSIGKIAHIVGKGYSTVRYWLGVYNLRTALIHRCRKCGETDNTKFYLGRYTCCKTCRNKEQTNRFRGYKLQAIEYKGGKCEICEYSKCPAALDFHHINPDEKDLNWKLMRNWTFERIKKELNKCQLVCRNCHAEIHYKIDKC